MAKEYWQITQGLIKEILARIEKVISENFKTLLKAFNEYCKGYKK